MTPAASPPAADCADLNGTIATPNAHTRPGPSFERQAQKVLNAARENDARAELGRLIVMARAHLRHLVGKVRRAKDRGDVKRVGEFLWWLPTSFALRLCSADQAAKKLNGMRVKGGGRRPPITAREVIELAQRLDLLTEPHEPVRVRAIRKRGADAAMPRSLTEPSLDPDAFRYVCAFEFEDRTRQYAMRWLAEVGATRPKAEGQHVGVANGFIEMQRRIIEHLDAGHVFANREDIRNCYRHVDATNLHKEIGVSRRVLTNNALVSRDRAIFAGVKGGATDRHGHNGPLTLAEARAEHIIGEHAMLLAPEGLPQGSAASPILAQIALGALPDLLPAGTQFHQWVDDMLTLDRTPEEAAVTRRSLRAALTSGALHGHFEVKRPDSDVVDARRGLEFCGLYFYRHEGRFHARPATSRLHDCEAKIKACATLGVADPWWLAKAERILGGFLRNYPFWHVAHLWRARMTEHIAMTRFLRRQTGQTARTAEPRPAARDNGEPRRRRLGPMPAEASRALRILSGLIEPGCKRGAGDDPDEGRALVRRRPQLPLAA
jgi:hypothetical protein